MGPLQQVYGNSIISESGLPRNVKVASIVVENQWAWPVGNSTDLLEVRNSLQTGPFPNASRNDVIKWTLSHSGDFTINSAWQSHQDSSPNSSMGQSNMVLR